MDFEKIKKFYNDKGFVNSRSIRKEYKSNNKNNKKNAKTKVIGITGSKGKSTVAYLIHEYLKKLNYKSVLYSSIKIDSPASTYSTNVSRDVALYNEEDVLNIIEEVKAYDADFLILEVNDSAIEKKLTNLIDFDIKLLTNFNSKHNLDQYSETEYFELKKSFFENSSKNTICIYGLQDYTKEILDYLMNSNECSKKIYTSRHIANVKGVAEDMVDYLLYELDHSLEGLEIGYFKNKESHQVKTNLIMNYNALNIMGLISVIDTLGLYDELTLCEFLKNLKIPGRTEIYNFQDFKVIIDSQMSSSLYELYNYKQKGLVNNIIIITGSYGYGYKNWNKNLKTEINSELRHKNREYAAEILKRYADYVFITENESGKENLYDICYELKLCLNDKVKSEIVLEREEAIKKAIKIAKEKDVILIAGRGNRTVLCNSENKAKVLRDKDIVIKHFDLGEYYG